MEQLDKRIELLNQEVTLLKQSYDRRILDLEKRVDSLSKNENVFTNSLTKIDGALERIQEKIENLEQGTTKNLDSLSAHLLSIDNEFKSQQQQELKSYLAYKKIVIGACLTAIVGGLSGAVLTSFRVFGG